MKGRKMRIIKLDIDKLVGYTPAGSEEKRIKKLGSAKLGEKWITEMPGELAASADRADATA
jgi:hypothetical protein